LILVVFIKADLAEEYLLKMLCPLSLLFFASMPHSDFFKTVIACKEYMPMLIPEEATIHILFCFQTVITPSFSSSFFTTVGSPKTLLFIP